MPIPLFYYTHNIRKILILLLVGLLLFMPLPLLGASLHLNLLHDLNIEDQTFPVVVRVVEKDQPLNVAGGTIHFPADKVSIASIDTSNSIFNLWIEDPEFSIAGGSIRFGGGTTEGGFIGEGEIFNITFNILESGDLSMNLTQAVVLAHDGYGTDILRSTYDLSYHVELPQRSLSLLEQELEGMHPSSPISTISIAEELMAHTA